MDIKYETKECIVAFIDILGSSNAILSDAQKSLNTVHNAYDESVKIYKKLFYKKNILPSVKIFSDNIVIAVPYSKDKGLDAFLAVAIMSAIVQVQFLNHRWLTRGGISYGSYFADEIMVWGAALVKAYTLENSIAIYPRIIIDPDLVGEIGLTNPNLKNKYKTWIRQDEDHLFFINFLNDCLKDLLLYILRQMSETEYQVANNINNLKASQKWLWLSRYLEKRLLDIPESDGENDNAKNESQRN